MIITDMQVATMITADMQVATTPPALASFPCVPRTDSYSVAILVLIVWRTFICVSVVAALIYILRRGCESSVSLSLSVFIFPQGLPFLLFNFLLIL